MVSERVARPRTLSVAFGVYFLLMAIIAWYSGQTLGYHYTVDITRFTFMIYLLAGAIFLVGVSVAAVMSARSLDARIERLEGVAQPEDAVIEEVVIEETATDDVPPPLEETPAPTGDHVDRDIDELLVSLQEMEQDAGEEEVEPAAPVPSRMAASTSRHGPQPMATATDTRRLSALRKRRDGIVSYFMGPALAAIGAVGISAAMLPGSDAFLQTYFQLNTALLLGLGYTFVGIGAYVAASILLLVRSK
jgi:hypothetical protein